ncbi:hypothetical protein F2P81_020783 [Scophthalmus maximus]|uniref:Uncharacterized protein n=1 Tax=Scophthalmus maximus TaxID=52904 RepID=A0A6A4RTP3_SCOMX|nr:hypothetical protein F2P81_020783 [Scophthalmus maximus]
MNQTASVSHQVKCQSTKTIKLIVKQKGRREREEKRLDKWSVEKKRTPDRPFQRCAGGNRIHERSTSERGLWSC